MRVGTHFKRALGGRCVATLSASGAESDDKKNRPV